MVVQIFKNDDSQLVSNYRQISILPVLSKVKEKLAADQLIHHLNSSQLLHPMQHGFRAHHSTETATMVYFVERVKSSLDKGGVVEAIFLDLRKAFDTVNHNILSKFVQFNFSQNTSNWFKPYLINRSQCVRIQNTKSSFKELTTGVPQGSILGPLLFSLCMNDLTSVCQGRDPHVCR